MEIDRIEIFKNVKQKKADVILFGRRCNFLQVAVHEM